MLNLLAAQKKVARPPFFIAAERDRGPVTCDLSVQSRSPVSDIRMCSRLVKML